MRVSKLNKGSHGVSWFSSQKSSKFSFFEAGCNDGYGNDDDGDDDATTMMMIW